MKAAANVVRIRPANRMRHGCFRRLGRAVLGVLGEGQEGLDGRLGLGRKSNHHENLEYMFNLKRNNR